ncbi:MAG: hypothetical protein K0S60_260, partial [Evtepia sp.]|nr:hypothetical protein [Evtepia sp.]
MKRNAWKLMLLAGLLLCLSGCMFRGGDELFYIPRTSDTNLKLQEKIKSAMGNAEAISPISGSNTQAIQLVDLDCDGTKEAVAFFRDGSAERPLKIVIFKQGEDGNYEPYTQIEGAGSDIESIDYKDTIGGGELEILVSWQVTPTVHTLVVYSVSDNQPVELMQSGYTRYLAEDLNGDSKMELLLVQIDSSNPIVNRVEMYAGTEGALELNSSAPLSQGIVSLQLWEAGYLKEKVPMMMVTCEYGENNHITDVFCLTEAGLKNITLNGANRTSTGTIRHYTGIGPSDINQDGITEIPITQSIPSYQNTTVAENFWKITWKQYDRNGTEYPVLSTYHNNSDRWYLELPEKWENVITLSRPEHTTVGERAMVFSYWAGDPKIAPEPFLIIYRLTGNNRDNHAAKDNRFTLGADSETVYAAEFVQGS